MVGLPSLAQLHPPWRRRELLMLLNFWDWPAVGAVCLQLHTLFRSQCIRITMIVANIPRRTYLVPCPRGFLRRRRFFRCSFSEEVGLFSQLRVQS